MKFLKIGNEIINLAHVQDIEFKPAGVDEETGKHHGASLCFSYQDSAKWFLHQTAEYVWDYINEHLDMTVCPILQEVTK